MRRTPLQLSSAALLEFIDPSYLNNKRPPIPGGAWPKELLRKKSIGDLQQIWFALLKEKNMLLTMKSHYLRHSEELGAMPAPSRLTMIKDSMANLKAVMQERDFEATDRAVAIFKKRLAQGVYRYPPGPQLPPAFEETTSTVVVTLDRNIPEERVREIFGRYDVFDAHKGIASIEASLPEEVLQQKEAAEKAFEDYKWEKSDYEQHTQWEFDSVYDHATVELAPGVFLDEPVHAHKVNVPPPQRPRDPPMDTLERLKWQDRSALEKMNIQLDSYPNITSAAPPAPRERPTHPDEILGPWRIAITYDRPDGLEYVQSLNVSAIDGAQVLGIEKVENTTPYAARCPIYQEALEEQEADIQLQKEWPHVPKWSPSYAEMARARLSDIAHYNYTNVFDYTDREALLTGKSVWEIPAEIDYSCGKSINIPAYAEPPKYFVRKPTETTDTY